jgi:hypothetical protein
MTESNQQQSITTAVVNYILYLYIFVFFSSLLDICCDSVKYQLLYINSSSARKGLLQFVKYRETD